MGLPIVIFVPAPPLVGVELNPGPKNILSEWKRSQIVGFVQEAGKSIGEAKRHFKVSKNTVKRCLRKVKETGSVANRPGQGRKRKLSQKDRKSVLKRAKRKQDAPQIAGAISKKLERPISTSTIRRILHESPLKYLVIQEETKLTPENKAKRVEFARNRADYDWKFCLFSDEKTFEVGGGAQAHWQDPKKRLKREVESHPKTVHLWGGIGYYFKTPLVFFHGNLNSARYQSFLKKNLPPKTTSRDCPKGKEDDWVLVQDNAKWHKTKKVMGYLDQEAPFYMADFPAYSPEFNIIEDTRSQLNDAIKDKNIKNIQSLKRHLKKAWDEFPWETVRKSVDSIPNRLKKCIEEKGARFGY